MAVALQPNKMFLEVPPIEHLTKEQLAEGEQRYLKQKKARAHGKSELKEVSRSCYVLLRCFSKDNVT